MALISRKQFTCTHTRNPLGTQAPRTSLRICHDLWNVFSWIYITVKLEMKMKKHLYWCSYTVHDSEGPAFAHIDHDNMCVHCVHFWIRWHTSHIDKSKHENHWIFIVFQLIMVMVNQTTTKTEFFACQIFCKMNL